MKKILVTAYAVNPYKGSEDGTGWNWIFQIAKYNHVIAITRKNNQKDIEKYMLENPSRNYMYITFLYYDLPVWARFWKKGERGALLYFYLWQMFMPLFILKKKINFDLAHNLNFHNDWMPSFLWTLKKPLVWGPIGHHPPINKNYRTHFSKKQIFAENLKIFTKKTLLTIDPFLKICRNKSVKILAVNRAVADFHNNVQDKIIFLPAVGSKQPETESDFCFKEKFIVLSSGRFVPLKGFDIAIKAFKVFYNELDQEDQNNVEFHILGKGPEEEKLKKTIAELGLIHKVIIHGWLPLAEVPKLYKNASIFLFPSHEGAGMVVPEALSYKLPIICFDNPGPGDMVTEECGVKIPYTDYEKSISQFSFALFNLYHNSEKREDMAMMAKKHFDNNYDWNSKGSKLREIYESIGI